MGWADRAIEQLRLGQRTTIIPHGNSMKGLVESGERVDLSPITSASEELKVNDIVLVRVKGNVYLHLIKAIQADRFLIGNNRGGINGWVGTNAIYGRKE